MYTQQGFQWASHTDNQMECTHGGCFGEGTATLHATAGPATLKRQQQEQGQARHALESTACEAHCVVGILQHLQGRTHTRRLHCYPRRHCWHHTYPHSLSVRCCLYCASPQLLLLPPLTTQATKHSHVDRCTACNHQTHATLSLLGRKSTATNAASQSHTFQRLQDGVLYELALILVAALPQRPLRRPLGVDRPRKHAPFFYHL